MSRNVDERVVEMRFENKQFESGVDQTLSTLDKLEQKLQFKGSEAGISNLEAKVKNFDMSPMGNAAESVTNKFSALEVAGVAAIASIVKSATDAAINFGKNIFNKYFIKPVSDGFQEYELLQNTIQTIYTNTKNKGTTIEEIESGLDDLNKYADDTIYVMSDMTKAIGQFTNAGVNFADSKKAVVGFANFAAAVGATNEQLSRVEYQSSQAISAGVFRLMDWNSIQNSPMGGEYFQKALIKNAKEFYGNLDSTAVEAMGLDRGTINEILAGLDDMEKGAMSFRQSLSKEKGVSFYSDWLRSDIFMNTLKQFADDPELYEAATSVRTFTKMREALEEAAGSGWAQTWKLIVGDFGESKALWTDVSKTLSLIIDGVGEARNKIIEFWKEAGGRDDLIQGLKNSMEALIRILKPIKEAFDETLGPFLEQYFIRLSDKFEKFTGKLLIGEETATGIKNVFKVIFTVAEVVLLIFEKIADAIGIAAYFSGKLVGDIFQLIGKLTGEGSILSKIWSGIKSFFKQNGIDLPNEDLEEFDDSIDTTGKKVDELKDKLTMKEGQSFSGGLFGDKFDKYFGEGSTFSKIKDTFSKIGEWFGNIGKKIKDFISNQDIITKEKLTSFFTKIIDIGKQIPGMVSKAWTKLVEIWNEFKVSPEFQTLSTSLKNLGTAIWEVAKSLGQGAIDAFNSFLDSLKDPEKRAERVKTLTAILDSFASVLKLIASLATPAINGVKSFFEGLGVNLTETNSKEIEGTAESIDDLAEATDNLNDKIPKKDLSENIVYSDSKSFSEAEKQSKKWTDYYNEFVKAHGGQGLDINKEPSIFEKIFGEDAKYVKSILAGGGLIAAIALIIDRYHSITKLVKKAKGVLGAIKSFIEDGADIFGLKAFAKSINSKAKKFKDLAIGIGVIIASVAALVWASKDVDATKLWNIAGIVGVLVSVISVAIYSLGKAKLKNLDGISKVLAAVGFAVLAIVGSMALLGYLADHAEDPSKYDVAIATVFGVILAIGLLCYSLSRNQKKFSEISDDFWKDFIGLALSMYIIARVITKLANEDPGKLWNAVLVIGAIMSVSAVALHGLGKTDKFPDPMMFKTLGRMMLNMVLSLFLVILAIGILGKMKPKTIAQGGKALAAIVTAAAIIIGGIKALQSSKFALTNKDINTIENLGVAAMVLAIAADLIIPAIAALSFLASKNMNATIAAIAGIVIIFSVMTLVMAGAAKLASASGKASDVIEIAASLVVFGIAVNLIAKALGNMAKEINKQGNAFWKATGIVAAILGVFIVLAALVGAIPEASIIPVVLLGISGAIVTFSLAILILSVAAKNFGIAIDKFADGIHKLAKLSGKDIDQIKKNIIKFAENSEEVWVAIAAAFVSGVHVFEDAFDEVKPIFERILGWLASVISTSFDGTGEGLGNSLGNMILTALRVLVQFINEHSSEIVDLFNAAMAALTKLIVEGLIKLLMPLNMLSVEYLHIDLFGGLIKGLNDFNKFLDNQISVWTGLDFSGAADNITSGIESVVQAPFVAFDKDHKVTVPPLFDFSQPQQQASDFGSGLPGTVAGEITDKSATDSPPAGEAIGNDTLSGLNGFDAIWSGVAQNLIDSFVNTLGSEFNLSKVYNTTFGVGSQASQGLKDGTGTNSPSKEAIYVANMMNKGLVDTLTSSIPEAKATGYLYASSVVAGIKDGSDVTSAFKPSITPVLRSDSVTRQMATMTGALNTTRTMSVATTAKLASQDAAVMRKAADDMRAMNTYDDSKVVDNIQNLNGNIDKLGTAVQGMGLYMDGKKVGRIVSPTVNRALYTDSVRKGRNN